MKRGDEIGQPLWGTLAILNVFGGMAFLLIGVATLLDPKPFGWWITAVLGFTTLLTTHLLTNPKLKRSPMSSNWPGWGPAKKQEERPHYRGEPMEHPDIKWELKYIPRFISGQARTVIDFQWSVYHGPTGKIISGTMDGGDYYTSESRALNAINQASKALLISPWSEVKTNPCVLCEKPSTLTSLTCSPEHEQALQRAKEELAWT